MTNFALANTIATEEILYGGPAISPPPLSRINIDLFFEQRINWLAIQYFRFR